MTYIEVMKELESLGTEQNRKIYTNHGADLELFGVSTANIKLLAKKNKNDHKLGEKLLFSGNVDAIFLSQFIVDANRLTMMDLESLIESTNYYLILDNVVGTLAAKNRSIAFECLDKWINHGDKRYRQVAYSLYGLILSSYESELIDKEHVYKYVSHVKEVIHDEENRVRYSMNNFLIIAATTYQEFTAEFKVYAKEIGKVDVFMGKTACKVPYAFSYIEKIESMGNIGKKRKIK